MTCRERMEKFLEIVGHTIEKLNDPFGILSGDRYEYFVHITVPEEDELFSKSGLKVKVLFISDEDGERILHYHIIENETEKVLDFALDEEEEAEIFNYCKELIAKQS